MKFWVARGASGHYDFTAYAETEREARRLLKNALRDHVRHLGMTLHHDWRDVYGVSVEECETGKTYVR